MSKRRRKQQQAAPAPPLSGYEERFLRHFTPEQRATLLRLRAQHGGSFENFSRNGRENFYDNNGKVTLRWEARARGWSVRKVGMYRRVVDLLPDLAAQVDAGKLKVYRALQMAEADWTGEQPRLTREAARMERAVKAVRLLTPKQRQWLHRLMDRMERRPSPGTMANLPMAHAALSDGGTMPTLEELTDGLLDGRCAWCEEPVDPDSVLVLHESGTMWHVQHDACGPLYDTDGDCVIPLDVLAEREGVEERLTWLREQEWCGPACLRAVVAAHLLVRTVPTDNAGLLALLLSAIAYGMYRVHTDKRLRASLKAAGYDTGPIPMAVIREHLDRLPPEEP